MVWSHKKLQLEREFLVLDRSKRRIMNQSLGRIIFSIPWFRLKVDKVRMGIIFADSKIANILHGKELKFHACWNRVHICIYCDTKNRRTSWKTFFWPFCIMPSVSKAWRCFSFKIKYFASVAITFILQDHS